MPRPTPESIARKAEARRGNLRRLAGTDKKGKKKARKKRIKSVAKGIGGILSIGLRAASGK
jgi:hypothetical protein